MNGKANFRFGLPTGSQKYDVVLVQGETYTLKALFESVHEFPRDESRTRRTALIVR